MAILEQIETDLIDAVRQKDGLRSLVLRGVKNAIHNFEIGKRPNPINEEDIINVLQKEIKMRKDSIDEFQKGNRSDLVEKEQKELDIIIQYLPKQLPESELIKIIDETIIEMGASSKKDMGKVMSIILPKIKGRADNSTISRIVSEKLS